MSYQDTIPDLVDYSTPGPGPHGYVIQSLIGEAPKFSFRSRHFAATPNQNPGPNNYEPKGTFSQKQPPAYSFGIRTSQKPLAESPGPARYIPRTTQTTVSPPKYSLSSRNMVKMGDDNPAPNTYKVEDYQTCGTEARSISLASRYAPPHQFDRSPGPAMYTPQLGQVRKAVPDIVLKSRHEHFRPDILPGPGQYDIKSTLSGVSKSLAGRTNIQPVNDIPAPNMYYESRSYIRPTAPSISISGRDRVNITNTNPAPNNYNPKTDYIFHSSPVISCASRHPISTRERSPGPGQHQPRHEFLRKREPAYTLAGRTSVPGSSDKNPGPGTYYAEKYLATGTDARSFSLGSRHKQSEIQVTPGPGTYTPLRDTRGPAFTLKGRCTSAQIPRGPGPAYQIMTPQRGPAFSLSGRTKRSWR